MRVRPDAQGCAGRTRASLCGCVIGIAISGILHVAEFTFTEADDGAHVTVGVGDAITIDLSDSSAAGYRWTVSSLDERYVVVESHSYRPTSAAVGSAGTAVWKLSTRRSGTTRMELKKSRPWEPADSASGHFAIDLNIVA